MSPQDFLLLELLDSTKRTAQMQSAKFTEVISPQFPAYDFDGIIQKLVALEMEADELAQIIRTGTNVLG